MVDEDRPDLGGIGEAIVQAWASQVGIVANPVKKDVTGWDYLFELRRPSGSTDALGGLLDLRPPEMTCFVQVKTTRDPSAPIDVTLSNWERLAKKPLPAFFILIGVNEENEPTVAYVIHVGETWIAKALERLRKVEQDEHAEIHHKTMQLTWTENDQLPKLHGSAMKEAIRRAVGADLLAYTKQKGKWIGTLGYEERPYKVTISFPDTDDLFDRMADFAIGRLEKLPVRFGEVRRVRFGVEEVVEPEHEGESFMSIPEFPSKDVAFVEVADPVTGAFVRIKCNVRRARSAFPFLPDKFNKVAFVNEVVTFVVTPSSEDEEGRPSMTWSFHVPEQGDRVRLNDATVAARVTRLLAAPDAPAAAITLHVNDKAYRIGTARASVDPEILEHSGLVVDAARVAEWSGLAPDTYISRDGLEDQRNTVRLLAALLHDMNDVEATAKVENLGELKLAGSSAAILLAPYIDFSDHVLVVFAAIVGTPFLEESTSVMKVKGRGRILAKRLVRHEAMQTLDLRKLLGEVTGKLESEGIAPIVIPDTLRELPPGQT